VSASIGENPGAVINGDHAGPLRIAEKQLPGEISPSGDEQDRLPSGPEPLERGGFGGGVIGGAPQVTARTAPGRRPGRSIRVRWMKAGRSARTMAIRRSREDAAVSSRLQG